MRGNFDKIKDIKEKELEYEKAVKELQATSGYDDYIKMRDIVSRKKISLNAAKERYKEAISLACNYNDNINL